MELLEIALGLLLLCAPRWVIAIPLLLFNALGASLLSRVKPNRPGSQITTKS